MANLINTLDFILKNLKIRMVTKTWNLSSGKVEAEGLQS